MVIAPVLELIVNALPVLPAVIEYVIVSLSASEADTVATDVPVRAVDPSLLVANRLARDAFSSYLDAEEFFCARGFQEFLGRTSAVFLSSDSTFSLELSLLHALTGDAGVATQQNLIAGMIPVDATNADIIGTRGNESPLIGEVGHLTTG